MFKKDQRIHRFCFPSLRAFGFAFFTLFLFYSVFFPVRAQAVNYDIPVIFKDGLGVPITTALDLRISMWDNYDLQTGDIDGSGIINSAAVHYGDYQTTLTITPDEDGYFQPVTAGLYYIRTENLVDFPAIGMNNLFLQLEYKLQGSDNTSYLIYDFIDDPPFDNIIRWNIVENISYITTDAGSRTTYNTFILDENANAPTEVVLQFGGVLMKTLSYHIANTRFELNDDLFIAGTLQVENVGSSLSFRVDDVAGDTTPFVIDQTGNVGIGLIAPEKLLHLNAANPELYLKGNSGNDYSATLRFAGEPDDAWRGGYIQYDGSNVGTSYGRVIFGIHDANDKLTSSDIEVLSITRPNGYIGVGTDDPQSSFHIPDGKYLQIGDNNAGAPPAGDCDADAERGRISLDKTNNRLYICNGATRGWDYMNLID